MVKTFGPCLFIGFKGERDMYKMTLDDCLCYLTGKVFRQMLSCYNPYIREKGLTVSQLFVLLALYERDGMTPQELSSKLALNSSTLTGILDRLEQKGLVKREMNATDRRSIVIKLTDSAKKIKDELWHIYETVNGYLMSCLSQEELNRLHEIMGKLEKRAHEMHVK
jgi:DNA-binding MarR family transcriptional regulator